MNKIETRKYLNVALIIGLLFLVGCGKGAAGCGCSATNFTDSLGNTTLLPIAHGVFGKGSLWDFLVYPMTHLMFFVAKIVGYNYAVTILISTVLIRSIAWPIYGKTNDMTMKMSLLGPEQAKIEEKYRDKVDKASQQQKSMEMMQLYKKYKISFAGCLMPFIQMPIFLAFYETLRRIPATSQAYIDSVGTEFKATETVVIEGLLYNADKLNTKLFGLDLLLTQNEGSNWQKWGIYIIAALVAITQIGTQILSQRRAKRQREKMEENVPDYRKKGQTEQQKQSEKMMKIMLYTMPIMMVMFIVTSPAALGWYWLVGNIFTAFQTFISSKLSAKKMEQLRKKYNKDLF